MIFRNNVSIGVYYFFLTPFDRILPWFAVPLGNIQPYEWLGTIQELAEMRL